MVITTKAGASGGEALTKVTGLSAMLMKKGNQITAKKRVEKIRRSAKESGSIRK